MDADQSLGNLFSELRINIGSAGYDDEVHSLVYKRPLRTKEEIILLKDRTEDVETYAGMTFKGHCLIGRGTDLHSQVRLTSKTWLCFVGSE